MAIFKRTHNGEARMAGSVDTEKIREWFDRARTHELRGDSSDAGLLHYALYILTKIEAPKNGTVLELGCGDGRVMQKMRELRPDITFAGLDLSKALIDRAQEANPGVKLIACNALEPFDLDITFDRIVCFSVLQYLSPLEIMTLTENCLPHLSSTGVIAYLSIPNRKMRLARFTYEFSQRYPSFLAGCLAMTATLIRPSDAFGSDGSRWHDYEDIKQLLESSFAKADVHGGEVSDSWYRFDCFVNQGET